MHRETHTHTHSDPSPCPCAYPHYLHWRQSPGPPHQRMPVPGHRAQIRRPEVRALLQHRALQLDFPAVLSMPGRHCLQC